ncbi:MAG: amidohydrolase family protein [Planctomycetes bacterium]|nr:amidohydrolase family protein [Planctomycetota bacterium]
MSKNRQIIQAAMVVDGKGARAAPGALLLEGNEIIACGSPESIGPVADAKILNLGDAVVMPALVNVHCHLDLSHIGPIDYCGDFVSWIEQIRQKRCQNDADIASATKRGIELSLAGGTALVGDIAGVSSLVPFTELAGSKLAGVSYVEFFGSGKNEKNTVEKLQRIDKASPKAKNGIRLGLQPHAPYSCSIGVFEAAAQTNRPIATHLAETLEELEFLADAKGPISEMLKKFGVWDEEIVAQSCYPIEYLKSVLEKHSIVAAHLNYVDNSQIQMMKDWPISVAYCPRASAYFGHPHNGMPVHQYQQMIEQGINVALGTDGLLCLDTPDRISVLDEMRFLYKRDGADPVQLLNMATCAGAKALGFDETLVTLEPGPTAGLIAISSDIHNCDDPLVGILKSIAAPQWIAGPFVIEELSSGE